MKIGFIGAGKVGFSLGKVFAMNGLTLTGYYSHNSSSAEQAANFTNSQVYEAKQKLIEDSDVIYLTVPDDAIAGVWDEMRSGSLRHKIICHCSGSIPSTVFSGIEEAGACSYSVHPLMAVSDRYKSYQQLPNAQFTIEGSPKRMDDMLDLLHRCGLKVCQITPEVKPRYHAAAVMGSNLAIGLVHAAMSNLMACGFDEASARHALQNLLPPNVSQALNSGCSQALTGPIQRNDLGTVEKHLHVLTGQDRDLYQTLSRSVLEVARVKSPTVDYSDMEHLLQE